MPSGMIGNKVNSETGSNHELTQYDSIHTVRFSTYHYTTLPQLSVLLYPLREYTSLSYGATLGLGASVTVSAAR